MYCLNADSGRENLAVARPRSHTESSPCVVDAKVYFGAGDDGLFCVNAADGKPVWDDECAKGLHVDASPLVVGGRVYAGSGIGDIYQGHLRLLRGRRDRQGNLAKPTDLPVWGESSVAAGRLYVPLGNGNFMESDDRPAGEPAPLPGCGYRGAEMALMTRPTASTSASRRGPRLRLFRFPRPELLLSRSNRRPAAVEEGPGRSGGGVAGAGALPGVRLRAGLYVLASDVIRSGRPTVSIRLRGRSCGGSTWARAEETGGCSRRRRSWFAGRATSNIGASTSAAASTSSGAACCSASRT